MDGVRHIDLAPDAPDTDYLESHPIDALAKFCPQGDCQAATYLALEENDGDVWIHSATSSLDDWNSIQLVTDGSALGVDLAVDTNEIVVRIGGVLGSQSCVGSDASSLSCTSDSTERRDLFEHAGATWIVEGQSLLLLDEGNTTGAWEYGLPNGTLAA